MSTMTSAHVDRTTIRLTPYQRRLVEQMVERGHCTTMTGAIGIAIENEASRRGILA